MKNTFKRVNARMLSCIKRSYADGVLRMRVSLDAAFQTWRSGQKERDGGRRRRGSHCQGPEAGNAEARESNVSQRWARRGGRTGLGAAGREGSRPRRLSGFGERCRTGEEDRLLWEEALGYGPGCLWGYFGLLGLKERHRLTDETPWKWTTTRVGLMQTTDGYGNNSEKRGRARVKIDMTSWPLNIIG